MLNGIYYKTKGSY